MNQVKNYLLITALLTVAVSAQAADERVTSPTAQQPVRTVPQKTTIPTLTLEQRIAALEAKINQLQSVLRVTPGGAALSATNLSLSGNSVTIQATGQLGLSGNAIAATSSTNMNLAADNDLVIAAGRNTSLSTDKDLNVTSGEATNASSGRSFNLTSGEELTATSGKDMALNSNANLTIDSAKNTVIQSDADLKLEAKKSLAMKGSKILEN